jgi:hypothetical protein
VPWIVWVCVVATVAAGAGLLTRRWIERYPDIAEKRRAGTLKPSDYPRDLTVGTTIIVAMVVVIGLVGLVFVLGLP